MTFVGNFRWWWLSKPKRGEPSDLRGTTASRGAALAFPRPLSSLPHASCVTAASKTHRIGLVPHHDASPRC